VLFVFAMGRVAWNKPVMMISWFAIRAVGLPVGSSLSGYYTWMGGLSADT